MFLSSIKYLELFLSYSASKGSNLNIPSADIIKLSALFKAFFIEILEFNNLSYIRDDLSGVGIIYYILRNPFGDVFGTHLYHENTHSIYYKGDQTVWTKYTAKVTLPVGSMPGIWGLLEVHLQDLANNRITYNFSELITFETFD